MRVRTAQKGNVRLAIKMQIFGVLPLASHEANVFRPPDGLPNSEFHSSKPRHDRAAVSATRPSI
jgi:hypothetical protein